MILLWLHTKPSGSFAESSICTHTLSLSRWHTHTHTHPLLFKPPWPKHAHTHKLLTHTISHTRTHAHTHTLSLSHTHTHTHTCAHTTRLNGYTRRFKTLKRAPYIGLFMTCVSERKNRRAPSKTIVVSPDSSMSACMCCVLLIPPETEFAVVVHCGKAPIHSGLNDLPKSLGESLRKSFRPF